MVVARRRRTAGTPARPQRGPGYVPFEPSRCSRSRSASDAEIYAFAIPLRASCTVTSVGLPDVGAAARVRVGGSGSTAVYEELPGLHILGMALRNTTTATPVTGGLSVSAPTGQAWTGAFASPAEYAYGPIPSTTWGDQTIRIALSPTSPRRPGQRRDQQRICLLRQLRRGGEQRRDPGGADAR